MNTMIAKLLAKENITVKHGNYRTAFFDVEKRVLGLPKWKDMGKDVYDLLVGHEVGHALYTPIDGLKENDSIGIPLNYLNIIEDIRIEKMIQRTYPGLAGSFKRGYNILNDQDFFSIKANQVDVNTINLMDRINLKAKLRNLIDVDFSESERNVVDQAFAVETWEDVIEACKALYKFNEENKKDAQEKSNESNSDDVDQNEQSSDNSEQYQSESDAETTGEDPSNQTDSPSDNSTSSQIDDIDREEDNSSSSSKTDVELDPHASITEDAFRSKEKDLLDTDDRGYQKKIVHAITRKQLDDMLTPYEKISKLRSTYNDIDDVVAFETELNDFKNDSKKFIGIMSKEFEMRKMAYRYNRSQTSRSGSLNMNKLHAYKVTDDIFNSVTTLADAKSHGMVMFLDFSGSMYGILGDVIKQTLILSEFCKKVKIPFDVYSFTTGNTTKTILDDDTIDHNRVNIVHLLSSSMNKSTYNEATRDLFMIAAKSTYCPVYDRLGGTPLNETVMASRFLLEDFKKKHGVQKVNAIFMTDGDAQDMYIKSSSEEPNSVPTKGLSIEMDGKYYNSSSIWNTGSSITSTLLGALREDYTVIGYFLAERLHYFRSKIWNVYNHHVSDQKIKELRKEYNKNKFISFKNKIGYDEFFIIKAEGDSLSVEDEEFEVSENAKKGEIQRAFKKHATSKKTNKLFATQFAKLVA